MVAGVDGLGAILIITVVAKLNVKSPVLCVPMSMINHQMVVVVSVILKVVNPVIQFTQPVIMLENPATHQPVKPPNILMDLHVHLLQPVRVGVGK